ncbi:MAG: hypothetical protein ACFFG0_26025 [Candidatus Thorarchaeota archaeon]
MYSRYNELFRGDSLRDVVFEESKNEISRIIQTLDKNIILFSDIEEIIESYKIRYSKEEVKLNKDEIYQLEAEETTVQRRNPVLGNIYNDKAGKFTLVIPFEGNGNLLYYRPSLIIFTKIEGEVINNEIHLYFVDSGRGNFKREVDQTIKYVEQYIESMNKNILEFNNSLERFIRNEIIKRKNKLQSIESKSQTLGFPIKRRGDPPKTFQVPIKQKEIKLVPPADRTIAKPAPTIATEIYESILEICQSMSLVMERNPKTFREFDEESIRDIFLLVLNAFFKGEASGETFNKKGKTDILIRHKNANIFIAECKFWAGPKVLHETIKQLLGYCTWRDTKTAIFFFNKSVNITTILKKIDEEVKKDDNYKGDYNIQNVNLKKQGVYGYKFSLPEDKDITLFLTILIFDIPEPK